ncbi:MAG TPA: hypothetical protein ENJ84_09740 [Gammaproteobacteria bacterium]|nr:hypothetical protein [Gammaproteobacteria bacterium]
MTQDARERAKWKVRLTRWVDELPSLIQRPVKKLMLETTFGILSSGTLQQSVIARALKEPCRLHHAQKRLSRMLARHNEVSWAAEQLQLQQIAPLLTEDMILAIDPGDLNRDGAPRSELRGRVRDGNRGGHRGRLSAAERRGPGCKTGKDPAVDYPPAIPSSRGLRKREPGHPVGDGGSVTTASHQAPVDHRPGRGPGSPVESLDRERQGGAGACSQPTVLVMAGYIEDSPADCP